MLILGFGPYSGFAASRDWRSTYCDDHDAATATATASRPDSDEGLGIESGRGSTASKRWGLYVLLGTIGIVILLVALHLLGGGHGGY